MKNYFKHLSKKFNAIIQYPELIPTLFNKVNRGFCKDLLFLKKELNFNFSTIIDVGAAVGEYSKAAHFIFPNARIFAFEPIPNSFEKLKKISKEIKNMQCFNLALSDQEGESEFHLNEFSFSSSLLEMTNTHKEVFPFTKNETIVKVKTNKLDNILNKVEGGILLKIDVQGAELSVLKGAVNLLKGTDVVQLEVNFLKFYEGQALIESLIAFLRLYNFNSFFQVNPVFNKNKLLYSDFIFMKY